MVLLALGWLSHRLSFLRYAIFLLVKFSAAAGNQLNPNRVILLGTGTVLLTTSTTVQYWTVKTAHGI